MAQGVAERCARLRSRHLLEDARAGGGVRAAVNVALHVRVAEKAGGVDSGEHAHEVVEARVERAQRGGSERVRLCPVRLAGVLEHDRLELREELPVGDVQPVRPVRAEPWRSEGGGEGRREGEHG